ncbi:UDP-Glycosyltransferase/glycogen phosphorylase [Punctularia strigosozonata HHB-11173 SS5]|uniref:UDP-Glycosyltransferase/glycogen phosphorylase n=1 Tax=Punctularia strigosozonata (strain HHB-11173) TaxID=741275 RepID=UPI0004417BC5|nr:UDP-Glycosyltransferase/glycogen phosphorylase [Punctularia strigosozonata HHB-11173 SS5]EIN08341.1 UDP-Glycosyltransferase/glycogen phosphorylase [Punctularia strigosozonata HHB-11173 SS5]
MALRLTDNHIEYAVVIHDGMGLVGSEHDEHDGVHGDIIDRIVSRAKEYCEARGHSIAMFAVAGPLDEPLALPKPAVEVDRDAPPSFLARIWLELDAIPFIVNCRNTQFSLQGEATRAIETALESLSPTTKTIIKASTSADRHEVEVDANGQVHLYDLSQQAALTSPALWDTFAALACPIKKYGTKVSFFSATPRGGGVALMRHALIRVWRLVGLDIRWYVPQGDSAVFDVTKRKFHNVLQGVAPEGTKLRPENKELFEKWTRWNYDKFWQGKGGPIDVDIVVIDDPQLTALIPIIRRDSPRTKIIFRSHIEIRSDLIDAAESPQVDVFKYLFGYIRQADLFVSHPVPEFVPKMVHERMPVVYMPPSTDPLDGLNKPIPVEHIEEYRRMFNDFMRSSTGQQLDWTRGYILQVARFDPSKGIPDLLEGYRRFREELLKDGSADGKPPQLVLIGQTSIDDPDGTTVIHEAQEILGSDAFAAIRDDIYLLRAPPDDRLLDALMRGADIACQVSTREGFEIKVTEAIHKTRWIIATRAGGIPLQIRDNIDGKLVPRGDPDAIAAALVDFYTMGKDEAKTGESRGNEVERPLGGRWDNEGSGPREELFTIGNATMWQYLFCSVLGYSKKQVEELPEAHTKRFDALGLEGKKDLKTLTGQKVWNLLRQATTE